MSNPGSIWKARIRLENLVYVKKKSGKSGRGENFKFGALTLVPFEKSKKNLLSRDELHWLNSYHDNVYNKLSPFLNVSEKTWLRNACKIL